jgi:hypothetical protein
MTTIAQHQAESAALRVNRAGHSAVALADGRVAVWDDTTSSHWAVTPAEAVTLVERIESGERDAYSTWCSDTVSEEIHGIELA